MFLVRVEGLSLNPRSCNWVNVPVYVSLMVRGWESEFSLRASSVVKSRLHAGHAKYKSVLDGILSIIKNEGIGGVYKGLGNKLIQSVLTAAILFVGQKKVYEVTKKVNIPFRGTYKIACELN